MADSLLTIIQEFTDRRSLDRPGAVMSSQDDTIRQLRSLINEVIADICGRGGAWSKLKKEATFLTLAAELQGTVLSMAPWGFRRLILDSAFNRTTRTALFGPRTSPGWQQNEALPTTGPFYSYRIWKDSFYLQPAPPANQTIAFEYESDFAISDAAGTTFKKRFTVDTDLFLLNSDMLFLGLNAKFRREKGLSYAQEQSDYEYLLTQELGNDPEKGEINMAGGMSGMRPGFIVPSGNWNL